MADMPQLAEIKFEPYWWEDAPRPELPERPLPARADVVVVGSGYTGLSAALTLVRGGRNVLVCEAEVPGYGASSRNGGGCGTAPFKLGFRATEMILGRDGALELWREGPASVAYLAGLIEQEQIACDFVRSGRFTGAHRPGAYEAQAQLRDLLWDKLKFESEMVPRSEQHREIGTDFYYGGRVVPDDARLHPGRYHAGLLDRVMNAGVAVSANTPVTAVARDGDGFRIDTPRGVVQARNVVVGTNGYTGGAVPFLQRRMIPVRSQMIATEPLSEALMAKLMPRGRLISDTKLTRNYYRPSPDGKRILMGGRPTLRDAPLAVSALHLRDFLVRVFPELENVKITHSWDGKLGFTFDQLPHIGEQDGIHYAGGYLGSGVAMATYLGHKMGLRVLGSAEARTPLDDRFFPTMPFYRGNPWFLATVAAYYRLRDRIG